MTNITSDASKKICYYDAQTNCWFALKSAYISDGRFLSVDSEPCKNDNGDFDVYILPGFIDAHCHLLENPDEFELSVNSMSYNINDLTNRAIKNMYLACKSGITTLKDMGGRERYSIDVVNYLNSKNLSRVYTSGCYFTSYGGHCSDRGAIIIESIDEFIIHIDMLCINGIRFCKLIHDDVGFSNKLLKEMVTAAHNKGMLVSCHAYTEKAAFESVIAGTDILEHAGDYSDKLLEEIKSRDIIIVPTFVAAYDSTPDNCKILSDVDKYVISLWLEGEKTVLPKLFSKGISVALGTDSGFPGTPCNSLIREVQLLNKEIGIPIESLLYSAFIVTPRTILMGDELGQIAPGYYADFLCYHRNPMENLEDLGYPNEIWINGRRVDEVILNSIEIRRLRSADISGISTYLRDYYFSCCELNDFWSDEEIECWISNKNDFCIGAFVDEILIGFCLTHYHIEARKVHLENIYVIDSYRKQGIAQMLISHALEYYSHQSSFVRFVGLVDMGNYSSIKLLEKNLFAKGQPMHWMQRNIPNDD